MVREDAGQRRSRAPAGHRAAAGEDCGKCYGTPEFEHCFREFYPKCENISVDYAVLEPRSAKGEHAPISIACPPNSRWNDLGSWASLYEYQMETRLRGDGDGNVAESDGHLTIEARNNYASTARRNLWRWSA